MRKAVAMVLMLALMLGAQYMAWRQRSDVPVTTEKIAGNPVDHYHADGPVKNVVLIAHGFAANKELMKPWGYYLAARGFDTYVIDEPGHGASQSRLPAWQGADEDALGINLTMIIDELVSKQQAAPGHIALVGHSMGGAAVTQAALVDPRIKATVAVSSAYEQPIPADKPANLLSLAAERDPATIVKAVVAVAHQSDGGKGELGKQYVTGGNARESDLIDGRNHITILYDAGAQQRAADWIAQSLGADPGPGAAGADYGWLWVALALLSAVGFVLTCGSLLAPAEPRRAKRNLPRVSLLTAMVMVAIAAFSAVLAVVYFRIAWLHIAVVDYLLPYFLVMALALLVLRQAWPRDFGYPVMAEPETDLAGVGRALAIFAAFVAAAGTIIHMNLSNFVPTAHRLLLLIPVLIGLLLYYAQEEGLKRAVSNDLGPWAGLLVGLVGKLIVVLTWLGAAALPNPQPFLPLIVPVIMPVLLLLEGFSWLMNRWHYSALGAATFTSLVVAWILVVTMPIV